MRSPGRRLAGLVILAFLLSASQGVAASATPAPLAAQGKLVLAAQDHATADSAHDGLYVANADGSGLRQITNWPGDLGPHWSPGGRWVAFVRSMPTYDRVMIVRGDGSGLRLLGGTTWNGGLSASPWSPDGKLLAWGGCRGLCVFDLASGRKHGLALGGANNHGFAWSPDGRKLAAIDGKGRLVIVDSHGTVLTVLASKAFAPAWSRDGRTLAFVDGKARLRVVSATGGQARVVARNALGGESWSHDGHRLLYADYTRSQVGHVRMLDLRTGRNAMVGETENLPRWSPDGSAIAFTRSRSPFGQDSDVWMARPDGSDLRQVTHAFPSGIGFSDFDWAAGSVPVPAAPPVELLSLPATSERTVDWVDGLARAGSPDSVLDEVNVLCGDPNAETEAGMFDVWIPHSDTVVTTESPCQDWVVDEFAVSSTIVAWTTRDELGGQTDLAVTRPGTSDTQIASWSSNQQGAPDIGWRDDLGDLVSDGSTIFFESWDSDFHPTLWRIADGAPPHPYAIPIPSDAGYVADADAGRILLLTQGGGLAVITVDGTVKARMPLSTQNPFALLAREIAQISDGLVAAITADTLRVYAADDGSLLHTFPLAHSSGHARLLAVGDGRVVYESGIEVHLLRLQDGLDQILDLPGQAGPVGALLTPAGLFVSYDRAYEQPQQGHILFAPAANLP
jgi:Tol biopolymer transport system component